MERYCVPSYPQIYVHITHTQNSSRDTHFKILLHILRELLFIDMYFKKQKQHTKNQGYMDTWKNFKQYHV